MYQKKKENHKNKLIHELKKYWKWIKDVIREWKQMKDEKKIQHKGKTNVGGISNLAKLQKT